MKAVNLLPADLRSAGSSGASGSPLASYAVLGALAVLVVLATTWSLSARQVNDRRAEVARLDAEAADAEAKAASLSGFEQTVAVAKSRRKAVADVAKARVDWAAALQEVSRTLPENAWLTSAAATTAPGVSVEGTGNPLRAGTPSPAIEIVGCTRKQDEVARLMARLRAMDGVEKVGLSQSQKTDAKVSGGTATSSDGDCRMGSSQYPQFNMVLFLRPPAGSATTAAAPAPGAPAAPATPAAAPNGAPK